MATQPCQLHFILFPMMVPGHMIPIIDIAKLLAQRGVIVSIITTPKNANRFASTIDRAVRSGSRIQLIQLRFPSVEAGLPENCENLDELPSLEMGREFFVALNMLQKDVAKVFEEMTPRPSCLISDMGFPWTTQLAERFNIPRIVFHGTSCFSLLCGHNIKASQILDTLNSDSDPFEVPNLPDRIVLRRGQVNGSQRQKSALLKDVTDQIRAVEKTTYGVVVNSFEDLEPEYVKEYSKVKGEKVWCIGPVSMCNVDSLDLAERGNKAAIDVQDCLKWLDQHEPGSVIYASLGSLARLTQEQMIELALGLEASNKPFIWALGGGKSAALEEWFLDSRFVERTKGVYRVGDLDRTIKFYTECLGMKLLRKRDIPEERYTNAFLGYGPEDSHFVIELTYNYGVEKYDIGSAFGHFGIAVDDVAKTVDLIKAKGGKVTREPGPVKGGNTVIAFIEDPDGYKFELLERGPTPEPLCQVMLRVGDLDRAIEFYEKAFGMELLRKRDNPEYKYTIAMMGYGPEDKNVVMELTYNYGITEYDKGNAYAQIAIGTDDVYRTAEAVKLCGGKITREPGPLPGINTKITACLDPDGWKTVFVDNIDFLKELE